MNNQAQMCSNPTCMWLGKSGKSIGLFVIRLFVGVLFLVMGYHKLFGGMEMMQAMVSGMHFPAVTFFAYLAALVEFLGGIALILGLGVRPFAALLSIEMLVAFFGIHNHSLTAGMAAFVLMGVCAGLVFTGAGRWCVWQSCCLNGRNCNCGMGGKGEGCACCQMEGANKKK